ncbi:MAG TPA: hypothetical protein VNO33_07590 [Kofleriaceae bacterium]|nr:hypothetical protein [Kofleriaceae bacterium]
MGLFDKKKKGRDDFDSPVEQIDLSAASHAPLEHETGTDTDEGEPAERPAPSAQASARSPKQAASPAQRGADAERRRARTQPGTYSIDDAVALMRTLPAENVELVVQVVKHTLESARIDIGIIIDDATAKQQQIESRISVLRDAIAELEREIDTRRAEIGQLEADNRETTRVKERLVLAEKLTQGSRPDTVVDSQGSASSSQVRTGRAADQTPPQRAKATSSPPPTPPPAQPQSSSSQAGNPNHVASGNHMVPGPSPVGPGGPVGSSSAVGPGGPAGSYSHKSGPSHTVISKK